MKAFTDKTIKTYIVFEESDRLDVFKRVFAEAGFVNVVTIQSLDDLLRDHLKANEAAWIVTGTMARRKQTTLKMLNTISRNAKYRHYRVSMFVEPIEFDVLGKALELGLMSWFPPTYNFKSVAALLNEFLKNVSANDENDIKLSAFYARKFLTEMRATNSAIYLEEKLIEYFPGDAKPILNLAKLQLELGKTKESATLLAQVRFLSKTYEEECKQVQAAIVEKLNGQPHAEETLKTASFGINSCVVVDPDKAVSNFVSDQLKELGVKNVQVFHNGEEAFEYLSNNPEPDIIFQEWKIPKLNGIALIQRIRSLKFRKAIIIVMSSLIKKEDTIVLSEMSVANVLPKPFGKEELFFVLRNEILQNLKPTEQKPLERKISMHLFAGDMSAAEKLRSTYLAMPGIPQARKHLINARFLYQVGNFSEAKTKAIESMNLSRNEPLDAVNMLGKCMLKLGDYANALKCFEKAQSFNPNNIQRLVDICDIHLSTGETEKAKEILEEAGKIDDKNPDVLLATAKVAAATDDTDYARVLIQQIGAKLEFVAYMNNLAIALSRDGKVEEGVQFYNRAIDSLPTKEAKLKSILYYNLGLCHARNQKLAESNAALAQSIKHGSDRVLDRAESLLSRIKIATLRNEPIQLKLGTDIKDDLGDEFESLFSSSTKVEGKIGDILDDVIKPGQLCLYLFYKHLDKIDSTTKDLVEKKLAS